MTMQLVQRDTLEGLAIPFGSPDRKDLQGEYFTPRTDFHFEWFPMDGRPTLYHHGLDSEASSEAIGRQISHEVKTDGVWVEVQLAKRSKWVEMIRRLLDQDALGFSSGALPHLVKTLTTGEIVSWPWVELSATPTPASPDARIVAAKYFVGTPTPAINPEALGAIVEYRAMEAEMARADRADAEKVRAEAEALIRSAGHKAHCSMGHPASEPCPW